LIVIAIRQYELFAKRNSEHGWQGVGQRETSSIGEFSHLPLQQEESKGPPPPSQITAFPNERISVFLPNEVMKLIADELLRSPSSSTFIPFFDACKALQVYGYSSALAPGWQRHCTPLAQDAKALFRLDQNLRQPKFAEVEPTVASLLDLNALRTLLLTELDPSVVDELVASLTTDLKNGLDYPYLKTYLLAGGKLPLTEISKLFIQDLAWSSGSSIVLLEGLVKCFQSRLEDGTVKIEKLCEILLSEQNFINDFLDTLRVVDVETSFKNQEITPNELIQMAFDSPEVFSIITEFITARDLDPRQTPWLVPSHFLTLPQAIQLSKTSQYWRNTTCYVLAVLNYTNQLKKGDPIIQELIPLDENNQDIWLFDDDPPPEEAIDALFSQYQAKAGLSARLQISAKWELAKRELELKSF
jgi:hypothetical protein